jgi:hypothetical protein
MHSTPLTLIGNLLQLTAIVMAAMLGFKEVSALLSILICGAILVVAYVFIRLPQMIGFWRSEGAGIVKLFAIQLVLSSAVSAIFYGAGAGAAWAFS